MITQEDRPMDVCNLCLQDSYPLVNTNISKRLSACIKFSRYLPKILQKHPYACELCLQNFNTFIDFHDMVIGTESKIDFLRNELSCKKINLKSICDGANMLEKSKLCRVCLKPVKWLGIYLYKNDTNILDFSLLQKMFSYCNLELDYEATEYPILCRQCLEMLQIIYNFKKTFTEAFETSNHGTTHYTYKQTIDKYFDPFSKSETGISVRTDLKCEQIENRNCSINSNIIESDPKLHCNLVVEIEKLPDHLPNPVFLKIGKYKGKKLYSFRKVGSSSLNQKKESKNEIRKIPEYHWSDTEDDDLADEVYWQTTNRKRVRSYLDRLCKLKETEPSPKVIKNEIQDESVYQQGIPKSNASNSQTARKEGGKQKNSHMNRILPAGSRITTKWNLGIHYTNDDLVLLMLYYKYTKIETEFPAGYWDIISNEWRAITHKSTCMRILSMKLYRQLSKGLIPQDVINKIKSEVKAALEIEQNQHSSSVELPSLDHQLDNSFVDAVESSNVPIKLEPPCDMDIEIWFPEPKIEPKSDSETESATSPPELDRMDIPTNGSYSPLKKAALSLCSIEHSYSLSQKHARKPKICTRHSTKLKKEFRCTECFFTTHYRWAAKRHTYFHQQGKLKIYECPSCTYRITSKYSLKLHMKTHYNDKKCPMLMPWYHEDKQSLEEKQEKLLMSKQT